MLQISFPVGISPSPSSHPLLRLKQKCNVLDARSVYLHFWPSCPATLFVIFPTILAKVILLSLWTKYFYLFTTQFISMKKTFFFRRGYGGGYGKRVLRENNPDYGRELHQYTLCQNMVLPSFAGIFFEELHLSFISVGVTYSHSFSFFFF